MKNAGIVGMGTISKYYLNGLNSSHYLKLRAICDINKSFLSKSLFESYPFYEDYREMIEKENLDYLIISTPPKTHYEIAYYALKHGVNVIVEKPGVLDIDQYVELMNYAKQHNLIFEVSYHWQNGSEVIGFNKLYDKDEISEISIHVDDPYSDDGKSINQDKIKLEGAFIDSGVNALSLIKTWLPYNKYQIEKVDIIRCVKTKLPIYVNAKLLIDNVKVSIEVDWRNKLNNKESYVIYDGRRIDIKHSLQTIIDGNNVYKFDEMERLKAHYYNYFKNYNGIIKSEDSLKIHKVLLGVVKYYEENIC